MVLVDIYRYIHSYIYGAVRALGDVADMFQRHLYNANRTPYSTPDAPNSHGSSTHDQQLTDSSNSPNSRSDPAKPSGDTLGRLSMGYASYIISHSIIAEHEDSCNSPDNHGSPNNSVDMESKQLLTDFMGNPNSTNCPDHHNDLMITMNI